MLKRYFYLSCLYDATIKNIDLELESEIGKARTSIGTSARLLEWQFDTLPIKQFKKLMKRKNIYRISINYN